MHHLYVISFSVTLFSALFSLLIFKKSSLTLVSSAKHLLILIVLGLVSFNDSSQVFFIPKYSLISINITLFSLIYLTIKFTQKPVKLLIKPFGILLGLASVMVITLNQNTLSLDSNHIQNLVITVVIYGLLFIKYYQTLFINGFKNKNLAYYTKILSVILMTQLISILIGSIAIVIALTPIYLLTLNLCIITFQKSNILDQCKTTLQSIALWGSLICFFYVFIYKINHIFSSTSSTFIISLILLSYFLIYRIFDGYIKTYLKQKREQRFNSNSILFDSLITELTISKSISHIFNAFSLFSKNINLTHWTAHIKLSNESFTYPPI